MKENINAVKCEDCYGHGVRYFTKAENKSNVGQKKCQTCNGTGIKK